MSTKTPKCVIVTTLPYTLSERRTSFLFFTLGLVLESLSKPLEIRDATEAGDAALNEALEPLEALEALEDTRDDRREGVPAACRCLLLRDDTVFQPVTFCSHFGDAVLEVARDDEFLELNSIDVSVSTIW